jgi:hypothetical protein
VLIELELERLVGTGGTQEDQVRRDDPPSGCLLARRHDGLAQQLAALDDCTRVVSSGKAEIPPVAVGDDVEQL